MTFHFQRSRTSTIQRVQEGRKERSENKTKKKIKKTRHWNPNSLLLLNYFLILIFNKQFTLPFLRFKKKQTLAGLTDVSISSPSNSQVLTLIAQHLTGMI